MRIGQQVCPLLRQPLPQPGQAEQERRQLRRMVRESAKGRVKPGQLLLRQPGQPKQCDDVVRVNSAGFLKTAASLGMVPGVLR